MLSVLQISEEHLLHNPVQNLTISNQLLKKVFSNASPGFTRNLFHCKEPICRDYVLSPSSGLIEEPAD